MAGVPVGDTTLLQRLKELDEKATPGPWEPRLSSVVAKARRCAILFTNSAES